MNHRAILSLCILLALLVTGCGAAENKIDASSMNTDEMKELILNANRAFFEQTNSYWSITTLDNGDTHDTLYEFVPPDKVHVRGGTMEWLVIGETVYAQSDAGWQQMEMDPTSFYNPDGVKQLEKSIGNIVYLGADTLDGQEMSIIQYTSAMIQNNLPLNSTNKVWIGQADGLIYKMESDGQIAAVADTGGLTAVHASTIITFSYDPSLTIEAP